MEQDKINRYINEICDLGKVEQFREVIEKYIEKIVSNGFSFSARYDSVQSELSWSRHHVMFSMKKEPLHIIWDILHELGHILSGEKKETDNQYDREIIAWNYTQNEMQNIPELRDKVDNLEKYREFCLNTHQHNG